MLRPTLRLYDGFTHTSPELRDEVKELQQKLKEEGFSIDADGLFGRDTETAVKRFQRDQNLDDDGIVGPKTWARLLQENEPDVSKIFQTSYPRDYTALKEQLVEAEKYKKFIEASAVKFDLQLSLIGGIGSRESKWGLALTPANPSGTGDTIKRRFPTRFREGPLPPDGGGFGRGIMQIDFDAHDFARSGNWADPKANIDYGCSVLKNNFILMKNKTNFTGNSLLRAAISAYNCGPGNTLRTIRDGYDIDYFTFGRNYSKDVLNRAGWFQLNGWE